MKPTILQQAVDEFLGPLRAKVVAVEGERVLLYSEASPKEIFDLEAYLRKEMEMPLEVLMVEKPDKNVLRRLK